MGNRPFHQAFIQTACRFVVLIVMIVLVAAPLVVTLTHGAEIDEMSMSLIKDVAQHDHVHKDSGDGHKHGPSGGHNPADHDHQLQALVNQATSEPKPRVFKAPGSLSDAIRNLMPEGPRRPPRLV